MSAEDSVLIILIVAGAGILRGFSGFGSAMVLTPLLSMLLPMTSAVPLIVLLEVALSLQLLPPAWKMIDRREVAIMSVAAIPGLVVGAFLLETVQQQNLRMAASLLILLFLALVVLNFKRRGAKSDHGLGLAGLLSGVANGSSGIGGPPIVLYYLAGDDRSATVRATVICYFFIIDVISAALFGARGLLDNELLWLTLMCIPASVLGVWTGTQLFKHASELHFRAAAYAIIAVAAILGLVV